MHIHHDFLLSIFFSPTRLLYLCVCEWGRVLVCVCVPFSYSIHALSCIFHFCPYICVGLNHYCLVFSNCCSCLHYIECSTFTTKEIIKMNIIHINSAYNQSHQVFPCVLVCTCTSMSTHILTSQCLWKIMKTENRVLEIQQIEFRQFKWLNTSNSRKVGQKNIEQNERSIELSSNESFRVFQMISKKKFSYVWFWRH